MAEMRVRLSGLMVCVCMLAVVAQVAGVMKQCNNDDRKEQEHFSKMGEECRQSGKQLEETQQLWSKQCQSRCEKYMHGQERQLCLFRCEKQFRDVGPGQGCHQGNTTDINEKKRLMKCERAGSKPLGG